MGTCTARYGRDKSARGRAPRSGKFPLNDGFALNLSPAYCQQQTGAGRCGCRLGEAYGSNEAGSHETCESSRGS